MTPGIFEPREVRVGERIDDKMQILSGIKAGDKVAVSGSYLIDSESQLSSGTRDQGSGTGKGVHGGHTAPAPSAKTPPARKDSLKMDDMKM